ncbi:MAG TPA: hypothetical protein ENK29_03055 [Chromatiales bacterium]|nr:hypothetical protein [Chromatiales bacterium]
MAKIAWDERDSPWKQKLGCRLEAAVAWLFFATVRLLPATRASALGRRLFGWAGPRGAKHRKVMDNLSIVLGEASEAERRAAGRQVWENFGAVVAEFPHLDTITDRERPDPAIEIVCLNQDPAFLAREKPCIFIAAHVGSWELSAFVIGEVGYPVDVIYSPLANPYLEDMVQRMRDPLGCGFITKANAFRSAYKTLKKGRSVGLHVDVRVDSGREVPFFGVPAPTTELPMWLSRKTGCPIVPIRTERLGDARFRTTIHPCLPPPPEDLDEEEAMLWQCKEMNRVIAGFIADRPGQWWCGKRRWKKTVIAGFKAGGTGSR